MKSFRYQITSLMMALIVGLSLTVCNNETQAKNHQQEDVRGQIPEGNVNKAMLDSISNFKTALDSISNESKTTVEPVKSMQSSVSELERKEIWLWIAVGVSIILSMILFGITIILYSNLQGRANRQRNDIIELQRGYQASSFAPKPSNRASTPSDYEYLKRRIYDLEIQIRQITSMMHTKSQTPQSPITPISPVVDSTPSSHGYFGTPIQATEPYFRKLLTSCDSDARFAVEIIGERASFKPLESSSYFGTIVSNDAMKAAIDFIGSKTPTDASSMRVDTAGEAVLKDGRWYIIRKASVILS